MPEWILQIAILSTSAVSQYLYAFTCGKKRRPAYIITLCAQPLWMLTAWRNGQWAIFLLSFWFAYNSIRGIRNHWRDESPIVPPHVLEALQSKDWIIVDKRRTH